MIDGAQSITDIYSKEPLSTLQEKIRRQKELISLIKWGKWAFEKAYEKESELLENGKYASTVSTFVMTLQKREHELKELEKREFEESQNEITLFSLNKLDEESFFCI